MIFKNLYLYLHDIIEKMSQNLKFLYTLNIIFKKVF